MGLLTRLRQRLSRPAPAPAPTLGARWTPAMEREWEDLPEQVDASLKKVGSAIVSTWEVGAAGLGRALRGQPADRALIERYSDALVPLLTPYQDLHKGSASAMRAAREAAARASDPRAAAAPLLDLLDPLPRRAAEGLVKTVDYLDPLIARAADPAALRAAMLSAGPALQQSAARHHAALGAALARLPDAPDLLTGLCSPFEDWQAAVGRDVEVTLDPICRMLAAEMQRSVRQA